MIQNDLKSTYIRFLKASIFKIGINGEIKMSSKNAIIRRNQILDYPMKPVLRNSFAETGL